MNRPNPGQRRRHAFIIPVTAFIAMIPAVVLMFIPLPLAAIDRLYLLSALAAVAMSLFFTYTAWTDYTQTKQFTWWLIFWPATFWLGLVGTYRLMFADSHLSF